MIKPPRTKEEAQKLTYGWYFNQRSYCESKCAWRVWRTGRWSYDYQCSRKPGHGPDDLYCKQHAKMVKEV